MNMPVPFAAAALGIGRASVYVVRYGRVLAPFASQFARGFGRGLVPVYGSMANIYISRNLGRLGIARLAGGAVGDLTVGGMATSYVIGKLKPNKQRLPASSRVRPSMSYRYLYEF